MKRIAYLGLGIMGSGMATNLLKSGYDVTVWNRNLESCKPLVEKGATPAQTPAQAVENADAIMYSLSNDTTFRAVKRNNPLPGRHWQRRSDETHW